MLMKLECLTKNHYDGGKDYWQSQLLKPVASREQKPWFVLGGQLDRYLIRVIGVFRKYYLLCDSMNEALRDKWEASHNQKKREVDGDLAWGQDDEKKGEEGTQEPYFLLVERLELEDKELGKFIGGLLFIPIGIDDEGKVN